MRVLAIHPANIHHCMRCDQCAECGLFLCSCSKLNKLVTAPKRLGFSQSTAVLLCVAQHVLSTRIRNSSGKELAVSAPCCLENPQLTEACCGWQRNAKQIGAWGRSLALKAEALWSSSHFHGHVKLFRFLFKF